MRLLSVTLFAVLLVSVCCAQVPKEWPVANPGFEQGLQGWAAVKAENASIDKAVSHTGVTSLKLAAEDQFHPYVAQGVKELLGGATYSLKVWARGVKGGKAQATLKIEYYNAKGENTKGM
ncbi:MAG: carbohydrate binding domain-containing protein, partial [Armatimonadia bacterium]